MFKYKWRDQSKPLPCLHGVYVSIAVKIIAYGLSAFGGSVKEDDVSKINSLFKNAGRYGFTDTVYAFEGLLEYSDDKFNNISQNNHGLNPLLEMDNRVAR